MKMLIANHKMNLTLPELINYKESLDNLDFSNVKFILCPSMIYLNLFNSKEYYLGSQNVSSLSEGSLTGEISAKQLSFLNVKYSIVGHSERRIKLKEDNDTIHKKIIESLKVGIKPILCIGDKKEEKESGHTFEVLYKQIKSAFENLSKDEISSIIVAYEPVYSIGSGEVLENIELESLIQSIKNIIRDEYQVHSKVLYGGSVNESNIETLEKIDIIDGYLIGSASLNINQLKSILKSL